MSQKNADINADINNVTKQFKAMKVITTTEIVYEYEKSEEDGEGEYKSEKQGPRGSKQTVTKKKENVHTVLANNEAVKALIRDIHWTFLGQHHNLRMKAVKENLTNKESKYNRWGMNHIDGERSKLRRICKDLEFLRSIQYTPKKELSRRQAEYLEGISDRFVL